MPVQVSGADAPGPAAARWRGEAWAAAAVAAGALGKDLADVTLSATPAGAVDGPASALLAGGFAAAMLGDTIDPAATLAGAILPDGSIGPVAGLPEQVAAALAHGKTRIGVPTGMRVARSSATGKDVDVAQLARSRGGEAIEVGDVRDAFRLLTGHRLPGAVPIAATAMALEPAALARLDARYLTWQRKLADEWAALLQLEQSGRLAAPVTALIRAAHRRSERAEALYRAGKLVPACGEILAAWQSAAAANRTHAVIGRLAAGDTDGARAQLAALDPGDAELRAGFARIAASPPLTLARHLTVLEALGAALRAWAQRELAVESLRATARMIDELRGKPAADLSATATLDAVSAVVAPTALRLLRVTADLAAADQALELAPEAAGAPSCAVSPAAVARDAAALRGLAAAGAARLDALLVDPLTRKAGLIAEAARWRIAALEPGYLVADQLSRAAATGLPGELATAWGGESIAPGLLWLAAAGAAHRGAAVVIAAREVLAIHRNDAGRIDTIPHPPALRALLGAADRSARAAARAAQVATGAVPVQARLAYQIAIGHAAGGVDDQLDALAELWDATAISEAAVALVRACR